MTFRSLHRVLPGLALLAAIPLASCGEVLEQVPERPRQARVDGTNFTLDMDPIMRGTVASEAVVAGMSPVVVRGYGLVVGLRESGGRLMPAEVRAMMVQELARRGIGNPGAGLDVSPETMLNSLDTAVVIVEGVVPPGATEDTKFDLRVSALPGSDITSLEGGRLYTTDLRPGPLLVGSRQAQIIASGKGNIFINPFVEPGVTSSSAVNRLVGRVLDGGSVTKDMPLKLKLATSSHTRSRTIQSAINSIFPREARQKADTARGENADSIELTVPPSWQTKSEEFIELVRHVPLDTSATEVTALAVRRALVANPGAWRSAMWRFRALGKRALPVIQDLYSYPEEDPRMAALEAGAALDDPLAATPLVAMAREGGINNRVRAINLLSRFGFNPDIDVGLRPLLDDADPDIRLATYETLAKRGDRTVRLMEIDGKFDVALVPSSKPLIYIAQSGRPTIAIFGDDTRVEAPLIFSAWENRLLMKSESGDAEIQVYYRPTTESRAEIQTVDAHLSEVVAFLGHTMTIEKPLPGIGLSYGETIGALHALWRGGHIAADFKAEQDRVLAAMLRIQAGDDQLERPEFDPEPADPQLGQPGSSGRDLSEILLPPPVEVPGSRGDTVPR